MKKIIVFVIVSLLVGCNEKKITKEYLVGKWYCTLTEYENSEKNSEESWQLVDEFGDTETYKLIDSKLYIDGNNGEFEFFDIDTIVNHEYIELPINNGNNGFVKVNQSYTKVNKNKYILTTSSESDIIDNMNKEYYLRKKIVSSCERLN